MKIRFLGAARTVTGSCFHLATGDRQLLVDCGMYQGSHSDEVNKRPFSFDPSAIDYLFLTHAHIDHSGLIPKLIAQGFRGRIVTTSATADLAAIMLLDSAHIQEKDAEWLTKKSFRAGRDQIFEPLYTSEDAKAVVDFIDKVDYRTVHDLGGGLKYRFIDAGHILGSASLELWYPGEVRSSGITAGMFLPDRVSMQERPRSELARGGDQGQGGAPSEKKVEGGPGEERKIVFSGDLGKVGNPLVQDPDHPGSADYVLCESTYGNRLHKGTDESIDEFVEAIKHTFRRGGNVYMPTFAVGRTQDIIFLLNKLVGEGRLDDLDVYIDSPLADKATRVYASHTDVFDPADVGLFKLKGNRRLRIEFTTSVEESQKLNKVRSGAIIMAGSGMCDGGRIRHHFKHNLWRPECSVIFTGFQVGGTLGRIIVDGAKSVHLLGEEIAVRARVYTIGGFSAHADRDGLLEWLRAFSNKPEVFVIHGEEGVATQFAKMVHDTTGFVTWLPRLGEERELS